MAAAGVGEEGGSSGGGCRGRGCGGGGEEGGIGGRGPPGQGSCGGGAQGRCGRCEDEHRCWLACTPPRTTPRRGAQPQLPCRLRVVPAARFARPLHRLLLKPAAAPAPAAAAQLPTTPATARRRPAPRCPCTARRGPATACCSLALTPHRARPRFPGGAARAGCPASGCRAAPQRPRRRLTGRPPAGPCSARRRPSEGRREMREERKRETEKRERVGVALTSGPHLHVASTSAKPPCKTPPCKTAGWPKVNSFDSWMVEYTRFWSSMAKIKLG